MRRHVLASILPFAHAGAVLAALLCPGPLVMLGRSAPRAATIEDPDPGAARLQQLYREAVAARAERRFEDYAAAMQRAWELEPGHPAVIQHRARAHALTGNAELALTWMQRAAALGAAWDAAADTFLIGLRAHSGWPVAWGGLQQVRASSRQSARAFVVDGDVPMPEGIAWDTMANCGYLGSTLRRTIARVDASGRAQEFVAPARDGLLSPLGMQVDRARGLLWVASAAFEYAVGHVDSLAGRAALHAFDLRTGATAARWASPADSAQHNFNDVTVAPDGRVFVTDAGTGALYSTAGPGAPLEANWPAGTFPGANGITLDESGEHLFVAEYIRGVAVVHLPTGDRWRLTHAADVAVAGIDGLYFHRQGLIAVQNYAGLNRVARFALDGRCRQVTAATVLEAWHADFQEPTTAALVGEHAYVLANSQLDAVGADGAAPAASALRPIVILKVSLGDSR